MDLFFKELIKEPNNAAIDTINSFCGLLSEAVFSMIMNIRIMASRMLFSILKIILTPLNTEKIFTQETLNSIG
jgi:hypothetical protein